MAGDSLEADRVFVYGTLRRGLADNATARAFRASATFLCDGWLPGALHAVEWYPALTEAARNEGEVRGEIWELAAPGLMNVLDAYEGLFDPGPPLYRRRRRTVRTDGGPVVAWVYVYARAVTGLRRIESGDWADVVRPS